MYEFVRGPMVLISFTIFVLGITYQVYKLYHITRKKRISNYPVKKKKIKLLTKFIIIIKSFFSFSWLKEVPIRIKDTVLGNQPFVTILSFTFHACLIITPILLVAHNVLLLQSWGLSFFTLTELTTDIMAITFLICAIILLSRRFLVKRVRMVSSFNDYLFLIIPILPFLTGFLSYHQFFPSETILLIHMISGELTLIAIGVTKLNHMVFFFFVRLNIGSEFSFRGGSRSW